MFDWVSFSTKFFYIRIYPYSSTYGRYNPLCYRFFRNYSSTPRKSTSMSPLIAVMEGKAW